MSVLKVTDSGRLPETEVTSGHTMSPIKCAGMPWNCLQHFTQLLKSFLSLKKSLKLVKDHMHLCDLGKDGRYQNRPCL